MTDFATDGALMPMSLTAGEPAAVASNWPFRSKAVLSWDYLVVLGSFIAFNAYMALLARVSGEPAYFSATQRCMTPAYFCLIIGDVESHSRGGASKIGAAWLFGKK